MSVKDIDAAVKGRLRDRMRPEDLDTAACVELAGEILKGLADALSEAAVRAAESQTESSLSALKTLRNMYKSDYFGALSGGVVDGETAARQIIREALRGRRIRREAEE
jgi:hypothetical protein